MTEPHKPIISILGAGKVGIVFAQLAIKAGYTVYIAGSGSPEKIALTASILAPGAMAVTKETAAQKGDIVILALPLSKFRSIPKEALAHKLVIDAMNHWYEVDGPRSDTLDDVLSSSEAVQAFLPDSTVVKALSHMGYHELHDFAAPKGSPKRKAIAIASNDTSATRTVAQLVNTLGFDPVEINPLSSGRQLEPGRPGFGVAVNQHQLHDLIKLTGSFHGSEHQQP